MTCMDKRCLKHDLDITVDTWKYLFYFKLSQNIFVPWVYVKIKQCARAVFKMIMFEEAAACSHGKLNPSFMQSCGGRKLLTRATF